MMQNKFLLRCLVASSLLLATSACQEVSLVEPSSNEAAEAVRTIKVVMLQGKTTISYPNDDFSATSSLVWSEGDCVSYWVSEDGSSWGTSKSTKISSDGSFEAEIPEGYTSVQVKVLYPSIGNGQDFSDEVTVSQNQTMTVENTFNGSNLKMLGTGRVDEINDQTESIDAIYNTVGHVIRLRLTGSTDVNVTKVGINVGGTDYNLDVNIANGVSLSNDGKYFYIVVPEGNSDYRPSYVNTTSATYIFGSKSLKTNFTANGMTRITLPLSVYTKVTTEIYGQVVDASTCMGIASVPVSDGYSVVKTDKNGVYQIQRNTNARTVQVTVPSEYKIPLTSNGAYTAFYAHLSDNASQRHDFTLTPLDASEDEFSLYVLGDIHFKNETARGYFQSETMQDITRVMNECLSYFKNPYMIAVGDINNGFSAESISLTKGRETLQNIELTNGRRVPFFATIGNHDQDPTVSGYGTASEAEQDYLSEASWVDTYGPNNYSFNRGGAHIVVVDDVISHGIKDNTLKVADFHGGLTDDTWTWLQQDLSYADKSKAVILVCHIPFFNGSWPSKVDDSLVRSTDHYNDVLTALTAFEQAHIFSGHKHSPRGFIHHNNKDDDNNYSHYICAGGQPVYEHNLRSVCGQANWAARICHDGSPVSYSVFKLKDGKMYNYAAKSPGKPFDYQMRVYDGNDNYDSSYPWYKGKTVPGADTDLLTDKLIISIFGDDDSAWVDFNKGTEYNYDKNWTVTLINNVGSTSEERIPVAKHHGYITDMCAYVFWNDNAEIANTHFWVANIPAESLNKWVIEAVHTIPFSGVKNYYYCSEITQGFTGFSHGNHGDGDSNLSYGTGHVSMPWIDNIPEYGF